MGCYAFDDGEHGLLTRQAAQEGLSVRAFLRKVNAAYDDAHMGCHPGQLTTTRTWAATPASAQTPTITRRPDR